MSNHDRAKKLSNALGFISNHAEEIAEIEKALIAAELRATDRAADVAEAYHANDYEHSQFKTAAREIAMRIRKEVGR